MASLGSRDERSRAVVIGSGLLGSRRALDYLSLGDTRVDWVVDPAAAQGAALARRIEEMQGAPCVWLAERSELLDRARPRMAFVAVPHDVAAEIAADLLAAGIDTLLEKPMGLNLAEAERLASLAERSTGRLAVGFNYRHYPAIARARELVCEGEIGRPLFARMILGHGGRPGYEQEWKLQRRRCGGGVLMDPGIHLL